MSLAFDEYGRPFLILREQEKKKRLQGLDAIRSHIQAARTLATTLRTSLGPKGLDKILVSADGEITITNDGATILKEMPVEHPVARLLAEVSRAQDEEAGDGTTGVVVLAGSLLEQAEGLLDRGIHPQRIADGYERGCGVAMAEAERVSQGVDGNDEEALLAAAKTTLSSKIVSKHVEHFARLAVEAVQGVKKGDRVDLESIRVEARLGGELGDSCLLRGIVLEKEWSHRQMAREVRDARIALLNCPFEPPRPKTKHKLDITTVAEYGRLQAYEKETFASMIAALKTSGANVVLCQWGLDDEANHLLLQAGLSTVRWVGGDVLDAIAMATGGRILARFADLCPEALGRAGCVREMSQGTTADRLIVIEDAVVQPVTTLLIRGGNKMLVEEGRRSVHDALCVVRNLVRAPRIVHGGGAVEMAMSLAVRRAADSNATIEQHAMRAFALALDAIPLALASNAGLSPMATVAQAKTMQMETGNPAVGIHPSKGALDMAAEAVTESLAAKRQQLLLATQVVRMILKIDDVVRPADLAGP